ncbi:OmpA/MotB family protein [Varunaivibrio sulfuroxidans]|uniref:Chemotaxis protein MotB n=1 Tax=Varunaivibrio sulfuroxidans TaxID=1773489 RepID=A0A4V2UNA9_9PROT|nr:flagellar motor protein MotB [Varunaivibrio sulfuroxidans]TCS61351.1 chemotaxis protein MotB [Varunaivibrio sulfuroxidans]WES31036.1 flagellar motor protein MotB [Varunaivibrio sulfuroxidans]
MPPPPPPIEDNDEEDWLITYADAITLLMAFFVMLASFSKIDLPTYEKVMAGISKEIGKSDSKIATPIALMKKDIETTIFDMKAERAATVTTDARGIVIELAGGAFFPSGSATLRRETLPFLAKIADTLLDPKFRAYKAEIEGHTDDDPIHTVQFPSNWQLSSARASSVANFFNEKGVILKRLRATGLADAWPKVPNRTPKSVAIPENQAKNRRVVIHIVPLTLDERAKILAEQDALYERERQKEALKKQGKKTSPLRQKPK